MFVQGVRDVTYVKEDSRITVHFVVHLYEDLAAVNDAYWVGAAVEIGGTQIWAGQLQVIALAKADDTVSKQYIQTWRKYFYLYPYPTCRFNPNS